MVSKHDVKGSIGPEGGSLHVLLDKQRIAVLDSSTFRGGLYLNRVNVPEGHRGQGIGSALLDELTKSSRLAGYRFVIVEPGGYNPQDQGRRVRFYEKHGFVRQEEGFYLLDLEKKS